MMPVRERLIAEKSANKDLREQRKELLEACRLVDLMFKRKNASTADADWLGDDEHEAWSAVQAAIAKAEGPK